VSSTPPPVTLAGFLEDTPTVAESAPETGQFTLRFRLVCSPGDDDLGEAVLPCVLTNTLVSPEAAAQCFPAGAPVEVTGHLHLHGDQVLFDLDTLDCLDGPEHPLPDSVEIHEIEFTDGIAVAHSTSHTTVDGDSTSTSWFSAWTAQGVWLTEANRRDLLHIDAAGPD
jgi:hypothetical protein